MPSNISIYEIKGAGNKVPNDARQVVEIQKRVEATVTREINQFLSSKNLPPPNQITVNRSTGSYARFVTSNSGIMVVLGGMTPYGKLSQTDKQNLVESASAKKVDNYVGTLSKDERRRPVEYTSDNKKPGSGDVTISYTSDRGNVSRVTVNPSRLGWQQTVAAYYNGLGKF